MLYVWAHVYYATNSNVPNVPNYFGNIGYVSLGCPRKLLVIEMHVLLVGFGRSYVVYLSVKLLCLLHTIPKQMV